MNSFQKHIPGLKRHDAKTSTIRQHYYPEGGWGWLICACVFVIHMLTTGMQFSYGVLYTELVPHVGEEHTMDACWVGTASMAASRVIEPFVVALCRRKSTRLTAVIGGMMMALAVLFTSFALQLHQIFLSWALFLGIGTGITRQTGSLMIGQYFKRRREFVEIIVQSGCGIGVTLFSVFFKEAIRSVGWRLGLQAVTGVVFSAFFLGIFYRPASLYHPQRRAILHLKNQRKKQVKDKKKVDDKPPYFDMSCLKSRPIQILVSASVMTSFGVYTPLFYLVLDAKKEGLDDSSLILLQTFLGFAYALGCIGFGVIIVKRSSHCFISRQYLCQASLYGIGICILSLTTLKGYYGYVLFMWLYGLLLGGTTYAFQMLTLEKSRTKQFSRAWSFIQGASSVPILVGIPVTGYINIKNPKMGYFFSSLFTLVGASFMFLFNYLRQEDCPQDTTVSFSTIDSQLPPHPPYSFPVRDNLPSKPLTIEDRPHAICTCGADSYISRPTCTALVQNHNKVGKSISFASSIEAEPLMKPEYLTCISEEGLLDHCCDYMDDCANSCSKLDTLMTVKNCSTNRPCTNKGCSDFCVLSFQQAAQPIFPPCGRRLLESSAVSFSEPESLSKLGQQSSSNLCYLRYPPYYNPTTSRPSAIRRTTSFRPRRDGPLVGNVTTSV